MSTSRGVTTTTSYAQSSDEAKTVRARHVGFARASYRGRIIGLTLGFLTLGCALYQHQTPWWFWLGPFTHGFLWPHVGWWLAVTASNPRIAERRNMMVDHVAGGAWIAVIGFNSLPSLLMLSMMCMNSAIAGGVSQLLRGLLAHLLGVAAGVLIFGVHWRPTSTMLDVLVCTPLLLLHPITVGLTAHRLQSKLQSQREHLSRLSRKDALSGLYNRQHWWTMVEAEIQQLQGTGGTSTLVMADIDHFKQVNDAGGHAAGDEAIRRFSSILRQALRSTDIPGRYGGEEFGILLPGTDGVQASEVMERVRALLQQQPLIGGTAVTVSFGVAPFDANTPDATRWIKQADELLYRAKAMGRDRVVLASSSNASDL